MQYSLLTVRTMSGATSEQLVNLSTEKETQILSRLMTPKTWIPALIPLNQLSSTAKVLKHVDGTHARPNSHSGGEFPSVCCPSAARVVNVHKSQTDAVYYGMGQRNYQVLCCIFGGLESFIASWIIIILLVSFIRVGNREASDGNVKHLNEDFLDVLFYSTYALLWICGMILIAASGVCVKENKWVSLTHLVAVLLDEILFGICLYYLVTDPERAVVPRLRGFSQEGAILMGYLMNTIPMLVTLPSTYFSLGLFCSLLRNKVKSDLSSSISSLKEGKDVKSLQVLIAPHLLSTPTSFNCGTF